MKIQVGETYKTGFGDSVTIVRRDESDGTYLGSDACWYYDSGRLLGFPADSAHNIVAEGSDTPDLEIAVGDVWVTRGGTRVKIIATDIPGDEPIAGYPLEYDYDSDPSASRVWSFSSAGRMRFDEEGDDDLVSKAEQPVAWLVRSDDGSTYGLAQMEAAADTWLTFTPGLTIHPLFERP